MNLTKEDLAAIRAIVIEVVDEKTQPLREAMKQVLIAQIEIVEKIEAIESNIKLIMFTLNLSPTDRELRKTLKKID